MSRKYFEFKGQRYDRGTVVKVQLPDGMVKETTYFGHGWFEGVTPSVKDFTVVEIVSPKYYVETYKLN